MAALAPWLDIAPSVLAAPNRGAPVLSGTEFDLVIEEKPVNFTGKDRFATAINGSVPAPVLRWKEGDTVTLNVTNNLAEDTSIHWHGIILPSSQDGVPNISDGFKGIPPGETFTYRFPLIQNGTYWYHSHSGFQEPDGAYGAMARVSQRLRPLFAGLEKADSVAADPHKWLYVPYEAGAVHALSVEDGRDLWEAPFAVGDEILGDDQCVGLETPCIGHQFGHAGCRGASAQ